MDNEILGYAASTFVIISLLMSNIYLLRWINLLGCLLFVIYGILISAYPVALMNAGACIINTYYLIKLKKEKNLEKDNA